MNAMWEMSCSGDCVCPTVAREASRRSLVRNAHLTRGRLLRTKDDGFLSIECHYLLWDEDRNLPSCTLPSMIDETEE